jgi:DNA polymerase-3 subunit delta
MPTYFFFGEDDFSMVRAVDALRQSVLDPTWASFNFDKILPEGPDAVQAGLNQAMTSPFGSGSRFVWLVDTTITQHCSSELLAELERTLPQIPNSSVLLLTTTHKPDGRLKSTKLLKKLATVREFSPIPPWKTELLQQRVKEVAGELKVKLTRGAIQLLAESVGNDTRLIYSELTKLQLYALGNDKPIDVEAIAALVQSNTQNSLKLAEALREGQTPRALELVADLIDRNEPALKITATLVGQFRTWLWVKLAIETGEKDEKAIAQAAEVGNPKRIYFLRQEVKSLSLAKLQLALPLLLELEWSLKKGAEETATLQTKAIELCRLFAK